jgi:glycerol-3-phosphate acyltransferase PlsX
MQRIAVDAMGGDNAPQAIVEGAVMAAEQGISVCLVGDQKAIERWLPKNSDIPIVHAEEQVAMDEAPLQALRRTSESSLRKMLDLVESGEVTGAMSCGHTGATMLGSVLHLKTLDKVDRPALAVVLPRKDGKKLVLLDVGANIDCTPEQLVCFAQMGAAYGRILGMDNPRVAVLANGEEEGKGNALVRDTLGLLAQTDLNLVGNMEPESAIDGGCDVLVCDGFVGNVLVKSLEAATSTVLHLFRQEIHAKWTGRFGAWLLTGAMKRLKNRVQWDAHSGSILLGTKGVVVVGHGRSNARAVCTAIQLAASAVNRGLVDRLAQHLK